MCIELNSASDEFLMIYRESLCTTERNWAQHDTTERNWYATERKCVATGRNLPLTEYNIAVFTTENTERHWNLNADYAEYTDFLDGINRI